MKDEHMKDAAQYVAKDVTLYVAKGVLGAAEDGSVRVLVVGRSIFQRHNTRMPPPTKPFSDT